MRAFGQSPEAAAIGGNFLDRAYEKAERSLSAEVIDPNDFEGIYTREEIDTDIALVERLERKFEQRSHSEGAEKIKQMATIFEAVIADQITLNEWFGEGAEVITSSKFDDYVNGVDGIVEFTISDGDKRHLALAIDVTFNAEAREKFDRIKQEIDENRLTNIRYFAERDDEDEDLLPKMGLENVPRVVVGVGMEKLQDLVELWTNKDNKKLANHEVRPMLLEEIRLQLEAFAMYAAKKDRTTLVGRYKEALELIENAQKSAKRMEEYEMRNDPVFDGIFVMAKNFKH